MITLSNKNLIAAVKGCKISRGETRDYVKYIVVKEGNFYVTDSRIIFAISAPDDLQDGFYQAIKKTKKTIDIVKVEELDNCIPDYDAVLSDLDGYKLMLGLNEIKSPDLLAYQIAKHYNACFNRDYLTVLLDMNLISELLFKENKKPIKVMREDLKICLMGFNVGD